MAEAGELGKSDWEDEDLLTQDEAGARLREEIEAEAAFIEAADDRSSLAVRRAQVRLTAMRRRLEHIDAALAAGVGVIRRAGRPEGIG
jgi:hypothetical protein